MLLSGNNGIKPLMTSFLYKSPGMSFEENRINVDMSV